MSERHEFLNISIENIAKVLALLATQGNYTYIDKLGYVPSKDLLTYYLRESLRDFHSLLRSGLKEEGAKELFDKFVSAISEGKINLDLSIDTIVNSIPEGDRKKLREISSLIAARALAISAKYIKTSSSS